MFKMRGLKFLEPPIRYLFLAILMILLVFPKPAFAFINPFSVFETMLGGIEEVSLHVTKVIIQIFFLYVGGLLYLYSSAHLLQHVISHPEWLCILNCDGTPNPLIDAGWAFTSGVANLFLILIFIIVALAYILKLETFQVKKTLPKLILVALLLNFSLVFVAIPVDISSVIFRTIVRGNEGLAFDLIADLGAAGRDLLFNLIGWIVALSISFMIPGVSSFAQLALVLLVVGFVFLANIATWVFQIVSFFLVGTVFFLYVFLFAARIFLVQILAILAPLAFLCLILPQTEQYWKEWLTHLVQWCFLGAFLLFFLVIGLRAMSVIRPPDLAPIPLFGLINLPVYVVYYFFMFIYLVVVLFVSNKFMPIFASFLISQASLALGRIQTVSQPALSATGRLLRERAAESKRLREWGKKQATAPTPELRGWRKVVTPVVAPAWALRRAMGKAVGVTPVEATKRDIAGAETRTEKIKEPTLALSNFESAMGVNDLAGAIGTLSQAIKQGGPFKELFAEKVKPEVAVALARRAQTVGAVPETERIAHAFLDKLPPKEREDRLREMGFKSPGVLKDEVARLRREGKEEEARETERKLEEMEAEWKAKGYTTITHKIIGEAKGDEIKEFAKGFWEDREIMEAAQEFWGGSQLRKAAEEFGRDFVDTYMEEVERRTPKWFAANNPSGLLYLSGNAAQDLGYGTPGGWSRAKVREAIRHARRAGRGELEEERPPYIV